jgi:hypothetical protein
VTTTALPPHTPFWKCGLHGAGPRDRLSSTDAMQHSLTPVGPQPRALSVPTEYAVSVLSTDSGLAWAWRIHRDTQYSALSDVFGDRSASRH